MNIYVYFITHSEWQLKKAESENTYKLKAWYVPPQPLPKPWAILHTLLLGDHHPALKRGSESTPQPILAVKTFTLQMECSKVKIVSNPESNSLRKFRHGNIYTNTGMRIPVPSPQSPSQAPRRAAARWRTCVQRRTLALTLHSGPVQWPWQRAADVHFYTQSHLSSWEWGWGAEKSE